MRLTRSLSACPGLRAAGLFLDTPRLRLDKNILDSDVNDACECIFTSSKLCTTGCAATTFWESCSGANPIIPRHCDVGRFTVIKGSCMSGCESLGLSGDSYEDGFIFAKLYKDWCCLFAVGSQRSRISCACTRFFSTWHISFVQNNDMLWSHNTGIRR